MVITSSLLEDELTVAPGSAPVRLQVGDRIDFGDPGEGIIIARDLDRVFLQSPVFVGWVPEDDLMGMLCEMAD